MLIKIALVGAAVAGAVVYANISPSTQQLADTLPATAISHIQFDSAGAASIPTTQVPWPSEDPPRID